MNFCAEIQRDRGGIEKMKSRNLKAMLFGAAFAASLTFVGAQPQMPLFPALEVHAASYQDVELDSKYDFEKAFQKALDVAPYIRFIHVPFWTQRRCKENFGLHRF